MLKKVHRCQEYIIFHAGTPTLVRIPASRIPEEISLWENLKSWSRVWNAQFESWVLKIRTQYRHGHIFRIIWKFWVFRFILSKKSIFSMIFELQNRWKNSFFEKLIQKSQKIRKSTNTYFSYSGCGAVYQFSAPNSQFGVSKFAINFFLEAGILTGGWVTCSRR